MTQITQTPSSFSSLLALPIDVLSCVHAYLSSSDLLCSLSVASHACRDLILEDASLWQGMCQRRFDVSATGEEGDDERTIEREPWFAEDEDSTANANASIAASSSSVAAASVSAVPNRWLLLFRSFLLTPPRPLQLQVLYTDDNGMDTYLRDLPVELHESMRRDYSVENILRPAGKAYCTDRRKNVHVVLALARTTKQKERDAREGSGATAAAASTPAASALLSPPAALSSSVIRPYPSSFLLTDFKVIAPQSGYTSPLSCGLLFLSDILPTPAQIAAWDDWSEGQWKERQTRLRAQGRIDGLLAEEEAEGCVAPGEGEPHEAKAAESGAVEEEEQQVESWYADVPVLRTKVSAPIPAAFPLQFDAALSASPNPAADTFQPAANRILTPLAAFFHLERNGTVVLDEPPRPAATSAASAASSSTAADFASASSSSALSASSALAQPLVQVPYSYRHRFPRPVHGRFLVLTFLRSSGEKSNIDVSYVGIKGFRRGMHAVQPHTQQQQAANARTQSKEPTPASSPCGPASPEYTPELQVSAAMAAASSAESSVSPPALAAPASSPCNSAEHSSPPPALSPDAIDDAFDFDLPLHVSGGAGSHLTLPRLQQYLRTVAEMSATMQGDVAHLDAQLARVQTVMQQQQAAQQQQHALRLRMLLLQTQQLQLQLTTQQLQTQATLNHAARLNATAASFLTQRREEAAALDAERALHRARLALLTEEKEREERLLTSLRARVAEAKQREEELQESVNVHRAAVVMERQLRAQAAELNEQAHEQAARDEGTTYLDPRRSSSSRDSSPHRPRLEDPPHFPMASRMSHRDPHSSHSTPENPSFRPSPLVMAFRANQEAARQWRPAHTPLQQALENAGFDDHQPDVTPSLPQPRMYPSPAAPAPSVARAPYASAFDANPSRSSVAPLTRLSSLLQPTSAAPPPTHSTISARPHLPLSQATLQFSSVAQPAAVPTPTTAARGAPFAFSARTQALLDSLRESRLQREAAAMQLQQASRHSPPTPDDPAPSL